MSDDLRMALKKAVKAYQEALEYDLDLAQQETSLKEARMASREKLNNAKDDVRDIEYQIRAMRPFFSDVVIESVQVKA